MPRAGTSTVSTEKLDLSRAPTAEVAAAALEAQKAAGLEKAAFVVVAVEPGAEPDAQAKIDTALA